MTDDTTSPDAGWPRRLMRVPRAAVEQHREVLTVPGVRSILLAGVMARLPVGMTGVAAALHFSDNGQFAFAGAITGTYVAGVSMSGQVFASVSKFLSRAALLWIGGVLATLATACLGSVGASSPRTAIVLALIAGAGLPPASPIIRSAWPQVVPSRLANPVFSLDVAVVEVTFILGPALVGLAVWLWGPAVTLTASGVPGLLGCIVMAGRLPRHPKDRVASTARTVLTLVSSPVFRLAMAVLVVMSVSLGVLEITIIGEAKLAGAQAHVGFMFALGGVGSLTGGLLLGPHTAEKGKSLAYMLLTQATCISGMFLAANLVSVGILLAAANLFFAPSLGWLYIAVSSRSAPESRLSLLAWMFTANIAGIALGNYVGGLLVDHLTPRFPFLLSGALLATAGAAVYATQRASLARGPRSHPADSSDEKEPND